MSTLRVTIEKLTVTPHPWADSLELAQVGLYQAVIPKDVYRSGEYALYIPEQAVLPTELIMELGLTGRLAGAEKNRVRAVKLRGLLSQGIVCRPAKLKSLWEWTDEKDLAFYAEHDDFADELGITKWSPPVPVHMSGAVEPAPDLIRWIEIENVKRYPDIFDAGEEVVATEKLHGTACLLTYAYDGFSAQNAVHMSSKGFGSRSLALVNKPDNLYWRAADAHNLPEAAIDICVHLGAARVGLFGEVYGAGVQDLHYGAKASDDQQIGYALFDVAVDYGDGEVRWLSHDTVSALYERLDLTVPRVPVLYQGPYDEKLLIDLAEGRETVTGRSLNIREGLVVRPAIERFSPTLGGRAIGKIVSEGYLTRKNGTEFE